MEWRLIQETGQLAAEMEQPRRHLTIAWDAGDRSLYLSVVADAVPNTQTPQRAWAAPISLLAAMLMLPPELHEYVKQLATDGRWTAEGEMHLAMAAATEALPQSWPKPSEARTAMEQAAKLAEQVERLSLDLAAADAFVERGAPV